MSPAPSVNAGAEIWLNNVNHLQTQATSITIAPRPHRVIDFDWLATRGVPRIVAAVGKDVVIFSISEE